MSAEAKSDSISPTRELAKVSDFDCANYSCVVDDESAAADEVADQLRSQHEYHQCSMAE